MTTTFTDKKGRTWDVALDLRKARQIDKADLSAIVEDYKFSILKPDRTLYGKLITDAPFLFAIIWAMVQDQAEAKWQAFSAAQHNWEDRTTHQPSGAVGVPSDFNPPPDTFPTSPKEADQAELEFVSGVNGPTIEAARNAMIEALADFFPRTADRLIHIDAAEQKAVREGGQEDGGIGTADGQPPGRGTGPGNQTASSKPLEHPRETAWRDIYGIAGYLSIPYKDLWEPGYTLKHLLIAHDTQLLASWDHTSMISCGIYNLTCIVINAVSKAKMKPKTPAQFHPYREHRREGMVIRQTDMGTLFALGKALCK